MTSGPQASGVKLCKSFLPAQEGHRHMWRAGLGKQADHATQPAATDGPSKGGLNIEYVPVSDSG